MKKNIFLRWLHQFGNPSYSYSFFEKWSKRCLVVGLPLLVVAFVWGLFFAPPDYQQGDSFRIIFLHVPSAMISMSLYAYMGVLGVIFMVWRIKVCDVLSENLAIWGAVFAFIALFSGAVWGKPTWGTWWVWDARLTSMLILFILYLGICLIRNSLEHSEAVGKICAMIAMIGCINLPIIKYSVNWWFTLHQPASFTIGKKIAMPYEMWIPLLLSTIALYLITLGFVFRFSLTSILKREMKNRWVKTLL